MNISYVRVVTPCGLVRREVKFQRALPSLSEGGLLQIEAETTDYSETSVHLCQTGPGATRIPPVNKAFTKTRLPKASNRSSGNRLLRNVCKFVPNWAWCNTNSTRQQSIHNNAASKCIKSAAPETSQLFGDCRTLPKALSRNESSQRGRKMRTSEILIHL
jgi:hypothetical protein